MDAIIVGLSFSSNSFDAGELTPYKDAAAIAIITYFVFVVCFIIPNPPLFIFLRLFFVDLLYPLKPFSSFEIGYHSRG